MRRCRWETAASFVDLRGSRTCFWFLLSGKPKSSCSEKLWMRIQSWLHRWTRAKLNASVLCWKLVHSGFCVFLLLRPLKDMELIGTCWALSCRPSRKVTVFPKFSWTRPTAWRLTGSSEPGRCVFLVVLGPWSAANVAYLLPINFRHLHDTFQLGGQWIFCNGRRFATFPPSRSATGCVEVSYHFRWTSRSQNCVTVDTLQTMSAFFF